MTSPDRSILITPRLLLRPSSAGDASRVFEIQSNWNVTRNLRMTTFPPDRDAIAAWFAAHEQEWRDGTAHRFAILRQDRMIGLVDVDEIANREGDLGYWLEEPAWGHGYAFEAAHAAVGFAFERLGLVALNSGHADDNAASGKILRKLGFRPTETVAIPSRARDGDIVQCRYRLTRPSSPLAGTA